MIERNSVHCNLCGDDIESTHRHDFRRCGCGAVAVDGGHDYIRRLACRPGASFTDTSICTHTHSPDSPRCMDCGEDTA